MRNLLNAQLNAEIRAATKELPPYIEPDPVATIGKADGNHRVNYRGAEVAYTAAVTLIHLPGNVEVDSGAEVLLVQRGRGDWHKGVWGVVSGYVDTMSDPDGVLPDELFDPVAFTVRSELTEECGMRPGVVDTVDLWLGRRFKETRFGGEGIVHILPVLGICTDMQKPLIKPDGDELTDFAWVPLNQMACRQNLSPGYITHTLPAALAAVSLCAASEILGSKST